MDRWEGKVAVVTGASAGIGEAVVIKLVEAGMKVAGFARRKERVEEIAKKLQTAKGQLHAVQCDVTNEENILKAFEWVNQNLGPVHVLVNNAGIGKSTSIIDGDSSAWREIIDTNVTGLCICTREAIKSMRSAQPEVAGHVININSVVGHSVLPLPQSNVYPASKHAVTALGKTLRHELNHLNSKIKVTSVSPGVVRTEFGSAAGFKIDGDMMKVLKNLPFLLSEDIADAVVFALSTKPHVNITVHIYRLSHEKRPTLYLRYLLSELDEQKAELNNL